MDGGRSRPYRWLRDEATRTVLLFATATLLGLASVVLFFYSPTSSPTRLHLGLILCATLLVFYLSLRSSQAT